MKIGIDSTVLDFFLTGGIGQEDVGMTLCIEHLMAEFGAPRLSPRSPGDAGCMKLQSEALLCLWAKRASLQPMLDMP